MKCDICELIEQFNKEWDDLFLKVKQQLDAKTLKALVNYLERLFDVIAGDSK